MLHLFVVSAVWCCKVAEWMGRREAWSAEKPPDPRTKPTRWEFHDGREQFDENLGENAASGAVGDNADADERRRIRSAEEQQRRVRIKNTHTAKDDTHLSFHNSRTNLITDRDVYVEDVIDERELVDDDTEHFHRSKVTRQMAQQQRKRYDADARHIDDDSMRRHEIDRGSDIDYNTGRSSLKNKREFFIKDGNVEILQLVTRDKTRDGAVTAAAAAAALDEDNIYVNVPLKSTNLSHPQLLMVDNSGKEILMRRFIEEQPDGKQIIREHYQIVPGATYIQSMPNEIQQNSTLKGDTFPLGKSGPNSIVYSQTEPEVKVIHTQPAQGALSLQAEGFAGQAQLSTSQQSLTHELENSLKQQNALLRQILLEKEKLETRYTQHEVALETQSLPGQSMAIATQTDCEAGTQTDADAEFTQRTSVGTQGVTLRRKARSENDDSLSEDEYEYVRFSPPNSPEGAYWIKRRRQKKRLKYRNGTQPRKRIVMVEEIKRKIRTPIKEEDDEFYEYRKRSPPKKPLRETKTSILRRQKNEENKRAAAAAKRKSEALNRDVLMEISDSLDEAASPEEQRRRKIRVEQVEYYEQSPDEEEDFEDEAEYSNDSDADEIVIKSNAYTPSHNGKAQYKIEPKDKHRFEIHVGHTDAAASRAHNGAQSRSSSEQREVRPEAQPRLSRRDSKRESNGSLQRQKRSQASSEPPHTRVAKYHIASSNGTKVTTTTEIRDSKRLRKDRVYQSENDLLENDADASSTRDVPKYMEWYYGKKKPNASGRTSTDSSKQQQPIKKKSTTSVAAEKRISKTRIKLEETQPDDSKYKPEPAPRKSPPKGNRMLKEDIVMNKQHKPKIETDTNHPLLQHSEHRFERENAHEVPMPPTKLPHYMYPETPPYVTAKEQHQAASSQKLKPKPSPIKENEIKVTNSKINVYIEDPNATHVTGASTTAAAAATNTASTSTGSVQKQLNAATLEDDHDSGIAMNSLLNSMGRRNPIAEKKSVFSIAYDDVSRVKRIASGGESPQY